MPLVVPRVGETMLLAGSSAIGAVLLKVVSVQSEGAAIFMLGAPLGVLLWAFLVLGMRAPLQARLVHLVQGFRILLGYTVAAAIFAGVWMVSARPLVVYLGLRGGIAASFAASATVWALCSVLVAARAV